MIGVGEAVTRGTTLIDEEDGLSDGKQGASDAKSNGGKGSSRGSLKRRIFGNSGGSYFTGAKAAVPSRVRSGHGGSIAPKDAYDAETFLSSEKQIESYFSNHKIEDRQQERPPKKKEDTAPAATFPSRDSASVTYGAAKNFKSTRSAISKSGMNQT